MKTVVALLLLATAPGSARITNTDLICSMRSMGMQWQGRWREDAGEPSQPIRLRLDIARGRWCRDTCDYQGQARMQGASIILGSDGDPGLPKGWKQEGAVDTASWAYTNTVSDQNGIVSVMRYECAPASFTPNG